MRALVTAPGNTAIVKDVPKPIPGPHQLLVAVKAVAINPVDALYVFEPSSPPGRTVGSDFCGIVEAWGNKITTFSRGERIAGFVHGACTENTLPGAFAEFVIIDASLVFRVPDDVSSEQAATIPLCFMTAAQALHLRLGIPSPGSAVTSEALIGINGGSSSVGQYAIQLAHLAGCKVLATASEANFEILRSLGANVTVDYRSPNYPDSLSAAAASLTPTSLTLGLDCIAEGSTAKLLTDAFSHGGKCIVLRSTAWQVPDLRSDVAFVYTAVWSMLGIEFSYNRTLFPASPSDYAHARVMYALLQKLLVSRRIKPNSVRLMQGGLDAIADGLEWIGGGDVSTRKTEGKKPLSAEKLVYLV